MLEPDIHLTESELLALRDRRDEDPGRVRHLLGCRPCKRRFAFLSAFKTALKDMKKEYYTPRPAEEQSNFMEYRLGEDSSGSDVPSLFDYRSEESHPDQATLASYFRGTLKPWVRAQVHEHVLGCERCMADVLVLSRDKARSKREPALAAQEHCREHGSRVADIPGAARVTNPQIVLRMEDGPGTQVLFRVLARPVSSGRLGPGREILDDRVEVMVKTSRVTITAHRDGPDRYLDVEVRDLGRIGRLGASAPASISLEDHGEPIAAGHTDERGTASPAVPATVREFDLRVDGGWVIPVLLRFRT